MSTEYCKNEVVRRSPYNKGPRLLDIMDTAVLDYLMGKCVYMCVFVCVCLCVCLYCKINK